MSASGPSGPLVFFCYTHLEMLRSYWGQWGLASNIEIGTCYAVVMKLTSVVFLLLKGFFDAIYDITQDFGNLFTSNDINLNRDTCFNTMRTINS